MGVAGVGGVGKKANFSELENPPIGKLEFLPTPPTPPLKTYDCNSVTTTTTIRPSHRKEA
jgi:hypothetical protein